MDAADQILMKLHKRIFVTAPGPGRGARILNILTYNYFYYHYLIKMYLFMAYGPPTSFSIYWIIYWPQKTFERGHLVFKRQLSG